MTTELALLSQVACRGREITAPRLRGLLALLAADLNAGCSTGLLVEGLWPDELPERPGKAVQVLVSRLRAQLGAELIVSTPTGYRLALDETQVDSSALLSYEAASAERARAGDHEGALAQAEAGLALWDGSVGAGAGEDVHDPVVALRAGRRRAHRALARSRALALARVGRRAEAAAPLAELARELPRDEEVLAELLRCEAATTGRPAALTRYDAYRRRLRDELGADPGPGSGPCTRSCCARTRRPPGTGCRTSRTRCWGGTPTSPPWAGCCARRGWSRSSAPAGWARPGSRTR